MVLKAKMIIPIVAVLVVIVVGAGLYYVTQPRTVEIKLQAYDFFFMDSNGAQNPKLVVKAGDTVKFTVENKGGKDHEIFVLRQDEFKSYLDQISAGGDPEEPEPAFKEAEVEDVEPGQTKTGTFVADTAGVYVYACLDHDGTRPLVHAHKGMFGTFEVQKPALQIRQGLGLVQYLLPLPLALWTLSTPTSTARPGQIS